MTGSVRVEPGGNFRPRNLCTRPTLLLALLLSCAPGHAQKIAFHFQTAQDCPVAFVEYTATTIRAGSDRRQFVTVKNSSGRGIAAMVFQQTISRGEKTEILTLERVSIIIGPREKKRLSVSVEDWWDRIQNAGGSDEGIGKPVLSVVVVEFVDGTQWNAPMGRPSD